MQQADLKLPSLAERLQIRHQATSTHLAQTELCCWLDRLLGLLLPQRQAEALAPQEIPLRLELLEQELAGLARQLMPADSQTLARDFFKRDLPEIDQSLSEDAEAMFAQDPAAASLEEVILGYPGFLAIAIYRIAHALHLRRLALLPRLLTEYAHRLTGIDIHPGALIGKRFCIDHGTGIVIGETTRIGDDVKLYQGVTLGALSVDKQMAHSKRHPTIEDRVVIYANATILGGETVIGADSVIGGNVWLTRSVDPFSMVYHNPQIQVRTQKSFPIEFMI